MWANRGCRLDPRRDASAGPLIPAVVIFLEHRSDDPGPGEPAAAVLLSLDLIEHPQRDRVDAAHQRVAASGELDSADAAR